ncbi:hypothetical protein DCS_00066 [Drechmeria coniospora]|uniref:Uncharacterized protein n=1 Tax=Drechmeria coniospora TaxID=98403 RepID=A0A151GP99_DRECN|nr:hypothetical protein DCS_00066 [Drechmeria coniospora]KYK58939.1 hypothetical protein DCS_00066 [Drechmeria coniospora]
MDTPTAASPRHRDRVPAFSNRREGRSDETWEPGEMWTVEAGSPLAPYVSVHDGIEGEEKNETDEEENKGTSEGFV